MGEAKTITLGGTDYKIRPLTFRQVGDLQVVLDNAAETKSGSSVADALVSNIEIIEIGMSRDFKDVDVWELEGNLLDSMAAASTVLALAGYALTGDSQAGETKPPVEPAA